MNFLRRIVKKFFPQPKAATRVRARVGFNPYGTSQAEIENDAEYALIIARNHLYKFQRCGLDLKGKNILEIGPGPNFGTIFILKSLGANNIAVADKFLVDYDANYHPKVYKTLLKKAKKQWPGMDVHFLREAQRKKNNELDAFQCLNCGLEDMSAIPDQSFDIVISNAVLEHLKDPLMSFKELARITKPGGFGFHQVDFRFHHNFLKPLEFLLMPEKERMVYIEKANYTCGNAWRASEYEKLFKINGFEILDIQVDMRADEEYFNDFMGRLQESSSRYRVFDEKDLRIISALFIIRK